jgi:hypothetical protein
MERLVSRKGVREGTRRSPNALSLRFISRREVLCMRGSRSAWMAVGISSIVRPVKISPKSASWTGVSVGVILTCEDYE